MEHFEQILKKQGCDIGRGNDIHPEDGRGRVGKSGFDKQLQLNDMIEIAYTIKNPRPNIIIKAGQNAKWYLKYCDVSLVDEKIQQTKQWRDTSRATMYVIKWESEY